MSVPKVSVIIPNYNHYNHLTQRIESVLNQSYQNFEVLLFDDCSTDDSRTILEKYRNHPKVAGLVYNSENSGSPFEQWRKGVGLSTGEWIWFAESDDYADKDFLQTLLAAAEGKENVGLIYSDSMIVNSENKIEGNFSSLKNEQFNTHRWSSNYINNGVREIEEYLLPASTINNASAALFLKKTLVSVNPFDHMFRYIGDKYAFVKVLSASNVVYVAKGLSFYRDPFNTKNADKYIYYFYEQFLVFDWALKNLTITNRNRFFDHFYMNTRNSLLRGWNKNKVKMYARLFKLNRNLFLKCMVRNFSLSFNSLLRTTQHPADSVGKRNS